MQVNIKQFDVKMDVKSKGIGFGVHKPGGRPQLGNCYLTMTGLIWCEGKTDKSNGIKISWNDLMVVLKSKKSKNAALKAAKQIY